jgi:hypothetical protein
MTRLGKIEIKKILAFRKLANEEYTPSECYICDKEYLIGITQDDLGKCPLCIDKEKCFMCSDIFEVDDMNVNAGMELECNTCYSPLCLNCNEIIEEDRVFCPKQSCKEQYDNNN